jgi:hypothetical protein
MAAAMERKNQADLAQMRRALQTVEQALKAANKATEKLVREAADKATRVAQAKAEVQQKLYL